MKLLKTGVFDTLFILIAFFFSCTSPESLGKLDGAVKSERIRAHLKILADDVMEGRAPGSRGGELAAKYIASRFEEASLLPAVGDSSFFQNFKLIGVRPRPSLVVRGGGRSWRFNPGDDFVGRNRIDQPVVQIRNKPMLFIGYGIDAPEFNWNDYANAEVSGKVLLMLVNEPPSQNEKFFGGKALTYYGRWTYKYEEAARKGAEGVILIHTTPLAGYGWNVVRNSRTREQFFVKAAQTRQLSFEGWLTEEKATELLNAAGLQLQKLISQANSPTFAPVELPFSASTSISNQIRTIETSNVVGMLRGSDPALQDECILYTTHYDHLGRVEPADGSDGIYNGAYDNASGTATLIEIARAFQEIPFRPKRSIIFAAVSAEESGLLGSQFYAQSPVIPLAKTAANINIDGVNVWGRTADIVPIGAERSTILQVIERVAAEMNMQISPDPMPEQGYFFRSDQLSFVKEGVPAVFLNHGLNFMGKPENWGKQLMDDYIKNAYHGVADEYDTSWSMQGAAQMGQFALKAGLYLANTAAKPEWLPEDPFQRIREKSLAEFSGN